jgi:hypothetical protein
MKAKINMASIRVKVAQGEAERKCRAAAIDRAQQVFDDAVIGMQKEFEEHPVTQEIDGGIGASNISQTLKGGGPSENLYSFIGFPESDTGSPTDAIRERLDPEHRDGPKLTFEGRTGKHTTNYRFKIRAPLMDRIFAKTPIPWAKGYSWAKLIEKGIPGFSRFLAKYLPFPPSRSGGGIQLKGEIRPGADYEPPKQGYLTTIMNNFIVRVRSYNKGGFRRRYKAI